MADPEPGKVSIRWFVHKGEIVMLLPQNGDTHARPS